MPRRRPPPQAVWHHAPAKVFDILYFLGTKEHSSWAVQTSDGLIVIDALFDYAIKAEVVDGLRALGVNPSTMKYLIISHMIAADGQKITRGDTTVTLYATPGHTAGAFSVVIPVKDNGRPHLLATWGGTAVSPTSAPEAIRSYIDSAVRYRGLVTKLGVEGIVSNHTAYDHTMSKLEALRTRKPNERHPYLTGAESVRRDLTVAEELGRAALALPRP